MNIRNSISVLALSLLATGSVWAQAPANGTTTTSGQRPETGAANGSGSTDTSTGAMKSGKMMKSQNKDADTAHQGEMAASGSMGKGMKTKPSSGMKSNTKPMNSSGATKSDGMKPMTSTDAPSKQ